MNNDEYMIFERPFREVGTPILDQLKALLTQKGFGPFGEISVTDHDIDRGLAFDVAVLADDDEPVKFVELKLIDGAEYGYEGVGLRLECSNFFSGCVWQPGNYTEAVSIPSPEEMRSRLSDLGLGLGDIADAIEGEWNSDHFKNQNQPRVSHEHF